MMNNMKKQQINKTARAYAHLREYIVSGEAAPGQRIVIDQVAKELGLSPIPVREAIRQLEADGLIQYKPYSGAIVTKIDETEYVETLSVLAVLEGFATALSTPFLTEEHMKKLKDLNAKMNGALDEFEFDRFGQLNREFHQIFYEHCGNGFLQKQIEETNRKMDSLRRSAFSIVPQRMKASIEEHETIIALLESKASADRLENYVRTHKLNTADALINRSGIPAKPELF